MVFILSFVLTRQYNWGCCPKQGRFEDFFVLNRVRVLNLQLPTSTQILREYPAPPPATGKTQWISQRKVEENNNTVITPTRGSKTVWKNSDIARYSEKSLIGCPEVWLMYCVKTFSFVFRVWVYAVVWYLVKGSLITIAASCAGVMFKRAKPYTSGSFF